MKAHEVIIVGAGGHALSLSEFASEYVEGYLAEKPNPEMPGEWFGNDESASSLIEDGHSFHIAFVYAGLPVMNKRRKLIELYEGLGAHFATFIAPGAIKTPHSRIGDGCAIMTGAIVNRAVLGRHVVVNTGAIVEHDCKIGANTFIGPGAVIGGFTTIGENCFIGLGARIGNGLKIGDNVSVAMGAVVSRDLLEPGIYHGSPLKRFTLPD